MALGEHIAELRKKRGLTQSKLAELAKVNPSTLAAYERNRRKPTIDAMKSIANALGISVQALQTSDLKAAPVNLTGQPSDNITTFTLSREEARLILFTRMNPETILFLQKYIMSDKREREQIERAWRLIHEFQT